MSKATNERVIDFDDVSERVKFIALAGTLRGKIRVSLTRHRPRRSLSANAFWWAAVIPAFRAFMESHGQFFEPEEIHEFFLGKFASKTVFDPLTGEVLSVIGKRSSKMDAAEFSEFVNRAIGWMADRFQLPIPEPEQYRLPDKPRRLALPAPATT